MIEFPNPLLRAIVAIQGKTAGFYLAGGTALSKYYLQHRLSFDLDLFCRPGGFERRLDVLPCWEGAGFKVVHEGDAPGEHEGATVMSRYRIYDGTVATRVDFVEDRLDLDADPEVINGLPVMGIDDIYRRKIWIGVESEVARHPRFQARDVIDLHALHTAHGDLSDRLTRGGWTAKNIQTLGTWLSAFPEDVLDSSIHDTLYSADVAGEEIKRVLMGEIRAALRKALGR